MNGRRNVGDILIECGRLTGREVRRALDFQRRNGGYFGEALIALQMVTRPELDWVLATQFDLPYVVPSADEVDLDAASLVKPEWAMAHTALPILNTEDALTVVLAEPNREAPALDQLRSLVGKPLRLALASPDNVHNLIRAVFARLAQVRRNDAAASPLTELWDAAARAEAPGLGISVRGPTAWAWFREGDRIRRNVLNARWEQDLRRLLDPDPQNAMSGNDVGEWRAELECHGVRMRVDVSYLGSRGGTELFIRPASGAGPDDIAPPGPSVVSEICELVRSGDTFIRVVCDPPALHAALLPRIPSFVLSESIRSIHLTDRPGDLPRHAASLRLSRDPDQANVQIQSIRSFEFDVITVDLTQPSPDEITMIAGLAPTVFAVIPDATAIQFPSHRSWELIIKENDQGRLDWRLQRLDNGTRAAAPGARSAQSHSARGAQP